LNETAILSHLEALAHMLDIDVRYERLEADTAFASGGLCRLRDRRIIIVNESAANKEKIRTLAGALRRFDLSGIYLKPALRDLLEGPDKNGD
jgi:hypothetical protein